MGDARVASSSISDSTRADRNRWNELFHMSSIAADTAGGMWQAAESLLRLWAEAPSAHASAVMGSFHTATDVGRCLDPDTAHADRS